MENVEFKILGVANKEDKLHDLLQRYLAPVILKGASEHASVRARVRTSEFTFDIKYLILLGDPNTHTFENLHPASRVGDSAISTGLSVSN